MSISPKAFGSRRHSPRIKEMVPSSLKSDVVITTPPPRNPATTTITMAGTSSTAMAGTDLTDTAATAIKEKKLRKYGIPKFVRLLREMLEVHSLIISWNSTGDEIVIHSISALVDNVLPKYFKHQRFSSFVRQLNYFGFKKGLKRSSAGTGGTTKSTKRLKPEVDSCTFSHPQFMLAHPELLQTIKRLSAKERAAQGPIEIASIITPTSSQWPGTHAGITTAASNGGGGNNNNGLPKDKIKVLVKSDKQSMAASSRAPRTSSSAAPGSKSNRSGTRQQFNFVTAEEAMQEAHAFEATVGAFTPIQQYESSNSLRDWKNEHYPIATSNITHGISSHELHEGHEDDNAWWLDSLIQQVEDEPPLPIYSPHSTEGGGHTNSAIATSAAEEQHNQNNNNDGASHPAYFSAFD